MKIETFAYDKEGNLITGTQQTTVGGQTGIFYLTFKIKVSNTGNLDLTNVRILTSSPIDLTNALQTLPIPIPLVVGQNNILLAQTDNDCTSDANCGAGEKCIGTPLTCKVDVSNIPPGIIDYSVIISGDYIDAFGVPKAVTTTINVPIEYQQERVKLRFEKKSTTGSMGDFLNSWIAYDRNGDGNLEGWGGNGGFTISNDCASQDPSSANFISYYGTYIISKYGSSFIQICKINAGVNNDDIITFSNSDSDAQRAILTLTPTEPYTSQNCPENNVNVMCQEIYTTIATQPPQVCGDGRISGTEVCEITPLMLNGKTCETCGQIGCGLGYTGDLFCDNCVMFDANQCIPPITPSGVKFRTVFSTISSSDSNNDAIAFLPTGSSCGTILTKAGEYSTGGVGNSGATCQAFMPTEGGTTKYVKVFDIPTGIATITRGAYTANSNFGLWKDDNDYAICGDNPRPVYINFRTTTCATNNNCPTLSNSASSVNSALESSC